MFTKEIIKRLPEYQNVEVSQPDFEKIDENINPLDFVKENDFISQIIGINPETGFPRNDIDILNDTSTNEEVRNYIVRCMRSHAPLSHPELDDEALFDFVMTKFENTSEYVDRLNKKYIQPFEEVESE